MRDDYMKFLVDSIPRWAVNGLWREAITPNALAAESSYQKLANVYSCLCRLDIRMEDDAIRKRIAMMLLHLQYENIVKARPQKSLESQPEPGRRGRGRTSRIVDTLLQNIHVDWYHVDQQRKSELRARFHEHKRYGKRWALLVSRLGHAILFLCSPEIITIM